MVTNTIFAYIILIAFTLQPWLHKCTSILYHTYTACLVIVKFQSQILSSVHPKCSCFHYKSCICIFSQSHKFHFRSCDSELILGIHWPHINHYHKECSKSQCNENSASRIFLNFAQFTKFMKFNEYVIYSQLHIINANEKDKLHD